jgi:hypothetical protein
MRFIYVAFKNVAGRVINVTRTLIAGANCVCPIEFEVSTRDEITIVLSNMFMKYFFFTAGCLLCNASNERNKGEDRFTFYKKG